MAYYHNTKEMHSRGEGHGFDYVPYVKVNDFNSLGTTCNPVDWKSGRTIHLLSQGEMYMYYLLRWNDDVFDIREQYPLDLETTVALAKELAIRHPKNNSTRMTSDLLVDYANEIQEVYSIKRSAQDLENPRTREKLLLEELYWTRQGIKFQTVLTETLDVSTVTNIRLVVEFYKLEDVYDEISFIKHLIATKQIQVDLTKGLIDYSELRKGLALDENYNSIKCRKYPQIEY